MAYNNYSGGTHRYRSRGEKAIGDFLYETGLPFRYEHPLLIEDRGKPRIWYPDFFSPELYHVIEYFGVAGDPGYEELKRKKATVYRANKIPATFLEPRDLEGRWRGKILDEIVDSLASRESKFERIRSGYDALLREKKGPRNVPVHLE